MYKYCSPTRSQITTGRYPYHNGFWHNNCPTAQLEGVPLKFVTIAEELQEAGFSTHAVGKWHQGQASDAYTPTRRGFDHDEGLYQAAGDHYEHMDGGYDWHVDDETDWSARGVYSGNLVRTKSTSPLRLRLRLRLRQESFLLRLDALRRSQCRCG